MAKPKATPGKSNSPSGKPKPNPRRTPNRVDGDVKGGTVIQGENHGTIISIGGGNSDDVAERLNRAINGVLDRALADLEGGGSFTADGKPNYTSKRGRKE